MLFIALHCVDVVYKMFNFNKNKIIPRKIKMNKLFKLYYIIFSQNYLYVTKRGIHKYI